MCVASHMRQSLFLLSESFNEEEERVHLQGTHNNVKGIY